MKLVLDTNVVVSGFLWGGACERLVRWAGDGRVRLFTSDALLAELDGVVHRRKFTAALTKRGLTAAALLAKYRASCEVLTGVPVVRVVAADPDDDIPVACAVAAAADALVTGDRTVRAIGSHAGVRFLTPAEAVELLGGADSSQLPIEKGPDT